MRRPALTADLLLPQCVFIPSFSPFPSLGYRTPSLTPTSPPHRSVAPPRGPALRLPFLSLSVLLSSALIPFRAKSILPARGSAKRLVCLGWARVGVAGGGSSNHRPGAPLSAQDVGWLMAPDLIWRACFFLLLPLCPVCHTLKKYS